MKHNVVKMIFAAVVVAACAMAFQCGKDEPVDVYLCGAREVGITDCKHSFDDSATKELAEGEAYEITCSGGIIRVTHVNMVESCDMTKVETRVEFDGEAIRVYEVGDGGFVDCVCHFDHTFEIYGIPVGTYPIVFMEGNYEHHRQEVTI